jgi:hypothetical protein
MKITAEEKQARKDKFFDLYIECGDLEKTCKKIGITTDSPYKWMLGDPDFKQKYLHYKEIGLIKKTDNIEERMSNAALGLIPGIRMPEIFAMTFWLRNNRKEKYGNKNDVQGQRTPITSIETTIIVKETDKKFIQAKSRKVTRLIEQAEVIEGEIEEIDADCGSETDER